MTTDFSVFHIRKSSSSFPSDRNKGLVNLIITWALSVTIKSQMASCPQAHELITLSDAQLQIKAELSIFLLS